MWKWKLQIRSGSLTNVLFFFLLSSRNVSAASHGLVSAKVPSTSSTKASMHCLLVFFGYVHISSLLSSPTSIHKPSILL